VHDIDEAVIRVNADRKRFQRIKRYGIIPPS
jgi:hypothetical protein